MVSILIDLCYVILEMSLYGGDFISLKPQYHDRTEQVPPPSRYLPTLDIHPFPTEALIVNLNDRGHGAQSNLPYLTWYLRYLGNTNYPSLPDAPVFHQLRPDSDN